MGFYAEYNALLNKPLAAVEMQDNGEKIAFRFQDRTTATFTVEGDCCSHSWIEHLTVPADMFGAVILEVKESDSVDATPQQEAEARGRNGYVDVLSVYHTSFATDRGEIILEYRNDSNGYYGGYLVGPSWS